MGERYVKLRRIEANIHKLSKLDPFYMPTSEVLRPFISDLLRDMVAEAIEYRKERNFIEAARLLHRTLLVYIDHVYPNHLQCGEDNIRVMEIRIFKATMSVFAGLFNWAIEESSYVAHEMEVGPAYAERKKEALLILCVAEAGGDLFKYRDGKLSREALKGHQKVLHKLNVPREQEMMVNLMAGELAKEVGPYTEPSDSQNMTLEPDWSPEYVKGPELLSGRLDHPAGSTSTNGSTAPQGHLRSPVLEQSPLRQQHVPGTDQLKAQSEGTMESHQHRTRHPPSSHSPARSTSSHRSQDSSSNQLTPPDLNDLTFSTRAWLSHFHFKLACLTCFVKIPHCEGIYAFKFLYRLAHVCPGDILICQLKSLEDQLWGRIRQRSDPSFTGIFRLCVRFFTGVECLPGHPRGYTLCPSPHSEEEMIIWEADRARNFNGRELVNYLRCREEYLGAKRQWSSGKQSSRLQPTASPPSSVPTGTAPPTPPPAILTPPPTPSSEPSSTAPLLSSGLTLVPTSSTLLTPQPSTPSATAPPPSSAPTLMPPSSTFLTPQPSPPSIPSPAAPPPSSAPTLMPPSSTSLTPQPHPPSSPLPPAQTSISPSMTGQQAQTEQDGGTSVEVTPIGPPESVVEVEPSKPSHTVKGSLHPPRPRQRPILFEPSDTGKRKSDGFSSDRLLMENRFSGVTEEFAFLGRSESIKSLMDSLRGHFVFRCSACFHSSPPRMSVQHGQDPAKCANTEQPHSWNADNHLLVLIGHSGGFSKIRPRPPRMPPTVPICWNRLKRYGCFNGEGCKFAHNEVEVEVWLFESRYSFISREELVKFSVQVHGQTEGLDGIIAPAPGQTGREMVPPFHHELRVLCGVCYPGTISERNERDPSRCDSPSGHTWGLSVIYEVCTASRGWCRVFTRNPELRLGIRPVICGNGQSCNYRVYANRPCTFPHYEEEKDLWIYQAKTKLLTIEEVVGVMKGQRSQPTPLKEARIVPTERRGVASQVFCSYCQQVFNEQWQLDQHLKSPEHITNLSSDQEKEWQHRDPPTQITNGDYALCLYDTVSRCRFSRRSDEENLCNFAHSEEELTEWKERHKYRMMKMMKAREQKLFSFLDELVQAYTFSNREGEVMVRWVPSVKVTCSGDLDVLIPYKHGEEEDRVYQSSWKFNINVSSDQKRLRRVGLLFDEHRPYFYLSRPSKEQRPQICPGNMLNADPSDWSTYTVEVSFTSEVLGCFYQWLVFDFGERPVLYVPLSISVGSELYEPVIRGPPVYLKEPWSLNNSMIIRYESEPEEPLYQYLKERYPPPIEGCLLLDEGHKMTRQNFKDHYHLMLYLEEISCNKRLKKFTGRSKLELFDTVMEEESGHKPPYGQLFGKISLTDTLLDDSEASQIVVTRVRFALLKFDESSDTVYEASVFSGKGGIVLGGDDSIQVLVSQQCVQEQALHSAKEDVNIIFQFQLERIPFIEMHFGVDNVTEEELIFPPANMTSRFPESTEYSTEKGMNPRQRAACDYICQTGTDQPPMPGPTLIIGPFGTGKTETLGKTIVQLLSTSSMTKKLLVCTHSNSAADWLIIRYLHPYLKERGEVDPGSKLKLLRLYATITNPARAPDLIKRNYAIFKERKFRAATYEDILDSRIVVTTLTTAVLLLVLDSGRKSVKGSFDYIFIDEAGQALETETIIPLGLADKSTMVVMAGDHIQIRPKVFSQEARDQGFHVSMLERLFLWDQQWHCNNACFLTYNYRMVSEILAFIARYHYHSELVAKGDHYRHPNYYPMSFLNVKGTDQLVGTSYVNMAEVHAIVEKVQELDRNWPSQWEQKEKNIAVLTPYRLQVVEIRKKLRDCGLYHINVERVQNVQGKEFRAVFISTVRTRNTLNKAQITAIPGHESSNEQFYYGFLSDEGELITALTRCQCLLYVIGDPVALCSVGACHRTWEKYIKECGEHDSLYPTGTTWEAIRQEIQAARRMLNPQAIIFNPSNKPPPPSSVEAPAETTPTTVSVWGERQQSTSPGRTTELNQGGPSQQQQQWPSLADYPAFYQHAEETPVDEFGDFHEEMDIEDEILKELKIQVKQDEKIYQNFLESQKTRGVEGQEEYPEGPDQRASGNSEDDYEDDEDEGDGYSLSDDEEPSTDPAVETGREVAGGQTETDAAAINKVPESAPKSRRAKPKFRMVEMEEHTFVVEDRRDRTNLESAHDFGSYESDEEGEHAETALDSHNREDEWLRLTIYQPEEYKVCIIRFEPSGCVFALPVEGRSSEEIVISSKRRRERALDGDKVVMHILSDTEGNYEAISSATVGDPPKKTYGEVKHILERSLNPKFKKIVCTIDPVNHDLMLPIDRGFPKMFPMGRKKRKDFHKRGKGVPHLQLFKILHYGNERFMKDRIVTIANADIPNKLFVVLYYEWFEGNPYPLGIVTEVLPSCNSPSNGISILKLLYGVKDQWPPSFAADIGQWFPDDWEIPRAELVNRRESDYRSKSTFTIDNLESEDLDDALHVERIEDSTLRVGVHIADVSYFIKKDTKLDKETRKRAVTFYPTYFVDPSHMIPTRFSTDLCSLLPGKDRLTISVIFTFDRHGREVGKPTVVRSIICSAQRLTYSEVERFLVNQEAECSIREDVKTQLEDLQNLTLHLRKQRLGDARFSTNPSKEGEERTNVAQALVEEMMIHANEAVANFLVEHHGMDVPMRQQRPPDPAKAREWLSCFEDDAKLSLRLSPQLRAIRELVAEDDGVGPRDPEERGSIAGSDISDFSLENQEHMLEENMSLTNATWDKLVEASQGDYSHLDIINIIGAEEVHPRQGVAIAQFHRIMERALYANASDQPSGNCGHFSLNKEFYTHFTSPIRRYIDLVVHRMVVAALEHLQNPYRPRELADICHHCNNQALKADKYGRMTSCLRMALQLKMASQPKLAFVEAAGDTGLQLMYPQENFMSVTRGPMSVPLSHLKPAKKPEDGGSANSIILYFKNSIYDIRSRVPEGSEPGAFLRSDRFVQSVSLLLWKEMLQCTKEERFHDLQNALNNIIRDSLANSKVQQGRIKEITCEVRRGHSLGVDSETEPKKYVEFRQEYLPGQVIQVQLMAGLQRGLLVPKVQLVNMTPEFNFCIEHRDNPILSFTRLADQPPQKSKGIQSYVNAWLPVVRMMVIYNAVSGDETTYIRGLLVQWYKKLLKDKSVSVCGCFSLSWEWCEQRNVRNYDYLCIRVDGFPVSPGTQLKMRSLGKKHGAAASGILNPQAGKRSVVLHAITTSVSTDKSKRMTTVEFEVHQNQDSCNIPQELFDENKEALPCTVEIISKSAPDRRMERALLTLPNPKECKNLIRNIVLQRPRKKMNHVEDSDDVSKYLLKQGTVFNFDHHSPKVPFSAPNQFQEEAIRQAMSNTFSVIQGPPGTGKTRTGAFLAYFFYRLNSNLPRNSRTSRPQILYCGPSNKSVDVITGYLKEFISDDFRIIRVYSESIEQQEFPIPGVSSAERKFGSGQEAHMNPNLKSLTLHHKIRSGRHGSAITAFEKRFKDKKKPKMTEKLRKEINSHKACIETAMTEEVVNYDVVLCTCNASGRLSLTKAMNIVQVIIDEAGMCSEPETLIPLVNHNPSQVVLIGDHMQLRPIIQEPNARDLGAANSLMEKYKERAYTLTIQYRMHEEICRFPSEAFYKGALDTAEAVRNRTSEDAARRVDEIWPGGSNYPRVFCHVVGKEETLTVRSEEGNEMSRSNPLEVFHVVRLVRFFIQTLGIGPEKLAILSQYRLQCAQIDEALLEAGLPKIMVSTVIKSQGSEWDYVILSTVRSMSKVEIEDQPGRGWMTKHLGFIMDENQMNVALTRAKRGFIIVGNRYLLEVLPIWRKLFESYESTNSLLSAKDFLV